MKTSSFSIKTVTAFAFIGAAAGIVIQILNGISSAKVPVGAIVLVIIAIAVLLRREKWIPLIGVFVSLLILIIGVFFVGGTFERLLHPEHTGAFIGTLLQLIGLSCGIAAGIITAIKK
jgi:hypothetical protein